MVAHATHHAQRSVSAVNVQSTPMICAFSLCDARAQLSATPLYNAAYYGKEDCVRAMLECGADKEALSDVRACHGAAAAVPADRALLCATLRGRMALRRCLLRRPGATSDASASCWQPA